jgi:hypothetical protein
MTLDLRSIARQGVGFGYRAVAHIGFIPLQVNTWDTEQGVARNLARNLSTARSVDAVAKPLSHSARAGGGLCDTVGNAYAAPARVRSYSGSRTPFTTSEIHANAFATPIRSSPSRAGFSSIAASANSFVRVLPAGYSAGGGRTGTSAGATVVVSPSRSTASTAARVMARGVHNPSDEEISLLVTMLTRSKSRGTNAALYENTRRS